METISKKQNSADKSLGKSIPWGVILLNLRSFIALFVVIIVFSLMNERYLSMNNLLVMVKHAASYAILAIGVTFVILTSGIDLSVGSILGFCGMVAGGLIYKGLHIPFTDYIIFFNVLEIIIIVLCVGLFAGFINGMVITKLNVTPFIATLGMLYVARGAAMLHSGGATYPRLTGKDYLGNTGFTWIGQGNILGVPVVVWLMIVVAIIALYITKKTPLGRHIYAIGGNETSAKLSGVRVHRVKIIVYMISGFCAAIAGIIMASQLEAAHPASGEFFELNAIAAVVLGGTSLMGGRGTILGTIVGAFVISFLSDGLVMVNVSEFWQMIVKGLVIVVAVVIDQWQQNIQKKVALKQQMA